MQAEIRPGVRDLGNNITQEWLLDGPILIFTGQEATHLAIDTWATAYKSVLVNWPHDTPLYVINDFSSPHSSLTPYAKAKTDEIIKLRPDVIGYRAVISPANFAGRIFQLWYAVVSTVLKSKTRIFYKRDEAILWIRTMIAQEKAAQA